MVKIEAEGKQRIGKKPNPLDESKRFIV